MPTPPLQSDNDYNAPRTAPRANSRIEVYMVFVCVLMCPFPFIFVDVGHVTVYPVNDYYRTATLIYSHWTVFNFNVQ